MMGFIIVLSAVRLASEAIEMIAERMWYFLSLTNVAELLLYILSILFVIEISPNSPKEVILKNIWNFWNRVAVITLSSLNNVNFQDWQWQCGAIAVWLSWMVLLLFVQKMPHIGIYVLMFNKVLATFMSFVVIFILFVLGFALSFYMLFQNKPPFNRFYKVSL